MVSISPEPITVNVNIFSRVYILVLGNRQSQNVIVIECTQYSGIIELRTK